MHLLVGSLLFNCKGDSLELVSVWLGFSEAFGNILLLLFLLLTCLCFIALLIKFSLICFSVIDLVNVLLHLNHYTFHTLDLLSVENRWLHHLLNLILLSTGSCSSRCCEGQGLKLIFEHSLRALEVYKSLINILEFHLTAAHLEHG